ncbi:MAG: DUF4159 domain-containing protein [Planctomycetaceae bacterium]|nr:DUF4159 domain-containing protein [Planctomycetaceae bacterium]
MQVAARNLCIGVVLLVTILPSTGAAFQQGKKPLTDVELRERVLRSIRDGSAYLKSAQNGDGSWDDSKLGTYPYGVTALALLALINSDVPVESDTIQRGLTFLRNAPPNEPKFVYEASLVIMAFCAAEELERDYARVARLTRLLEETQCRSGSTSGLWGYHLVGRGGSPGSNGEDHSNGQFAVLGLYEAAVAGVEVDREVWKRTHKRWLEDQYPDGGWAYKVGEPARGSMTTAGLSTVTITSKMLQDDSDVDPEGRPDCCAEHPPEEAFAKGRKWLADKFSVFTNPPGGNWHYYYLYGLERAGRLSNTRFFGRHDWYREGARYFVDAQNGDGSWREHGADTPCVSSSYALLFLAKGLSRVVVNKLDYTSVGEEEDSDGDWNRHPHDITNLIEKIDTLRGWPPRLTSQVLSLGRLDAANAVRDMNQAPVLYISGRDSPPLTDEHVSWLRQYIDEGGFIFAVSSCSGGTFDQGFRELIPRMFPDGDASLQRLQPDHPVFRSEYPLTNAEGIELYGVDFGCRTSIIYSPEDHGCLWQKWMHHHPRDRSDDLVQRILRSTMIGTNVMAYATGREPPVKLNESGDRKERPEARIQRGLTEIAQLRHTGGWDTAPKALNNLLQALNETVGVGVSPRRTAIPITYQELRRFPLVYMHGRYRSQLSQQERDALRDYLSRGPVLFADACCGSEQFDRSFRDLMNQMYPDNSLKPIPADHELFSETTGHQLDRVRLRKLVPGSRTASLQTRTETGPPVLEGIEIDGRFAVIYSRYDISCALEKQASLACDGYVDEDAVKLAVNIVLYAMLQDISWKHILQR